MPSQRPQIYVRPVQADFNVLIRWAERWNCSRSEAIIRLATAKARELEMAAAAEDDTA